MNVLSLFDGMSCGRLALERAGVHMDKYFASEVDKYAIQIAKKNYPDTILIGDVTEVYGFELPEIDLLIGGSPCQGFSFAGKGLAFDDPRSKLFFEFVRLLKEVKPKYFLLENVKMKEEHQNIITKYLGVEPICINSALVSAQNRVRYYWTNIPGVSQPNDKGIVLEDILENGESELYQRGRGNNPGGIRKDKSPSMTSNSWEQNVFVPKKANHGQRTVIVGKINTSQDGYILSPLGKLKTLTAGHSNYPKIAVDQRYWRKLTPVECERLQTLPDNYTEGVSNTQRYKMVGNSWTVDVIAHIFKGLKPVDPELEELLS